MLDDKTDDGNKTGNNDANYGNDGFLRYSHYRRAGLGSTKNDVWTEEKNPKREK
jgi:hypothetical protein